MHILDDLKSRGLVYQNTDEEALYKVLEKPTTLYCGFDPTADSLHIGHLLPVLILRRFQLAGHRPIALVGGGTGLIGDPSGKKTERTLNPVDVVQGYADSIKKQLSRFLDFESGDNKAILANNYEWLGSLKVIEFLRDIGKNFSVATMLAKESVESRISSGLSFTEFSYMILQSYDFMKLNELYDCKLQVGGSDQWGNITMGIDLIRRMSKNSDDENQAHGLTVPLVTKSDGTKFGKTEGGAVWLDPDKTSPYKFYQFWMNTDDRDVIKYLKYFTFLSIEEINELEKEVQTQPEKRVAQRTLAREVTELVHGKEARERAEKITHALFTGGIENLTGKEIEEGFSDVPSANINDPDLPLVDILIEVGAVNSKRQARESITNGAIYINGVRQTDISLTLAQLDKLDERYVVIRRGKKNYYLVRLG